MITRHATSSLFAALAGLLLAAGVPATASGASGYYTEDGRWVRHPRKHLLVRQPTVLRPHSVEPTFEVPVEVVPSPPPQRVITRRDPYATGGVVVAGAGLGGLLVRAGTETTVAPTYLLHLGLAVGQAEFALRLDMAPDALEQPGPDGATTISLFAPRATFNYRFLSTAFVHPVAGAGVEAIFAAPEVGEAATAFAATARVGLELAFPLGGSALALGLDTTGHLPFARAKDFPVAISAMLGFSAYLDYRF